MTGVRTHSLPSSATSPFGRHLAGLAGWRGRQPSLDDVGRMDRDCDYFKVILINVVQGLFGARKSW
jgi:hypothetical protein